MLDLAIVAALAAFVTGFLVFAVRHSWLTAQPDEWLLRVRNGRVVVAGIGITTWRKPGDVVVRFSSTIQRVRFSVAALTAEHLAVALDGFILWSVSPEPELAFRAFSKLGIANLDRPPPALKSRAHLLTSSQHHAFQALLAAELRAHIGTLSLEELLSSPRKLVGGLEDRLRSLSETLGIVMERTEILQVQPADKDLLRDLSARPEEAVREEAANARLEAVARLRQRQAEEAKHAAAEEAELGLAKVEGARLVSLREQEAETERQFAAEEALTKLYEARRERDEAELTLTLARMRRTADAERDAAIARQTAEEQKSPSVRENELSKLVAEQTAHAMASWQIRDAKWIQVGEDNPVGLVTKMILGMRELVERPSHS
jgi:flotillin